MDRVGQDYLLLALNLDRHIDGFVDAYFGPPELREESRRGAPRPAAVLADDAERLRTAVLGGDYDPQRRDFLTRQIRAMTAVIRNLSGERLDFSEEVELYFDITPEMVNEEVFEGSHREMDRLLPGNGSLRDRFNAWKAALVLPGDRILPVFDLALEETRRRTRDLLELPAEEDLSLELVKEQPWSAYNWYLGGYRSRVEVNTDLPVRLNSAVPLMAHEAYPGHHTEHALKEERLYRSLGRAEHAIQLLLAPECVVSEGIADCAQDLIFDDAALAAFLHDRLIPQAGLAEVEVDRLIGLARAADRLRAVGGNAALLLHREGRSPEDVKAYVEDFALRTPQEADQTMRFIQNPLFRSYIFNYAVGKALLSPFLERSDSVECFRRLLSEPFTPTGVRGWLKELDQ